MKLMILLLLGMFVRSANATWKGSLDLNPVMSPIVIRELHDGQWLAGVVKENIWHLDQDGIQRFHAGVFQAWNAEHGNASTGMVFGIDIPAHLAESLQALGDGLNMHSTFKPASLLGSMLSFNFIGGYRPFHSSDVIGPWVYGFGARLSIKFGVQELQKGL